MSRPFYSYRCARRSYAKAERRHMPRRERGNVLDAGGLRFSECITRMSISDVTIAIGETFNDYQHGAKGAK